MKYNMLNIAGIMMVATVLPSILGYKMNAVHEECVQSSGINPEELERQPPQTTKELLCYFKCAMEKDGFIDGKGDIDLTTMDKYAPNGTSDSMKNEVKQCFEKIGKVSECKDVEKVIACIPM